MSWGMVAGAAVSVIGGAVSSNKASKAAKEQQNAANSANAYQGEIAKDQYNEYKTTYRPLERAMVNGAQEYDTPEAFDRAASAAAANTSRQIGLAEQRMARTPGLDPSSAAAQAGRSRLALQGAALGATGQNAAREGLRDKAWARKMDALGLGKGLVTGASTGMANAARTSAGLADASYGRAVDTATNVGGMLGGLTTAAINKWQAQPQPQTYSSADLASYGAVQTPALAPMGKIPVGGD